MWMDEAGVCCGGEVVEDKEKRGMGRAEKRG